MGGGDVQIIPTINNSLYNRPVSAGQSDMLESTCINSETSTMKEDERLGDGGGSGSAGRRRDYESNQSDSASIKCEETRRISGREGKEEPDCSKGEIGGFASNRNDGVTRGKFNNRLLRVIVWIRVI